MQIQTSTTTTTTTTGETHEIIILAFVNPSSGGGQGVKVLQDLRSILGSSYCYDLKADSGPANGLNEWKEKGKNGENLIVIAAGGDGTVGWILSVIDKLNFDVPPTVVPLALGTANDMSRVLRWGKGYSGENLDEFLDNIKKSSETVKFDRWKVSLETLKKDEIFYFEKLQLESAGHLSMTMSAGGGEDETEKNIQSREAMTRSEPKIKYKHEMDSTSAFPPRPNAPSPTTIPAYKYSRGVHDGKQKSSKSDLVVTSDSSENIVADGSGNVDGGGGDELVIPTIVSSLEDEKQHREFVANNYFSIGIDSKMLLDFDTLRKNHPELFPHRAVNYGWYGLIGLKSMVQKYKPLAQFTTLKVDGKDVTIPLKAKAIVCLNVPSYCGGTNPWGNSRNSDDVLEKTPQSICDGTLEIFAMYGAAHFGRNLVQASRGGIRICQATTVELITTDMVAGQVDGEPYLLAPSRIKVSCMKQQANMLYCTVNDPNRSHLKKLLGGSNL